MNKKTSLLIFLLLAIAVTSLGFLNLDKAEKKSAGVELNREKILSSLDTAIAQKKREGNYRCCIEPACKMCFLGDWKWDDGSCLCDDHVAKGEWDQVCPECKGGMENNECQSDSVVNNTPESCPVEFPQQES